MSKKEEYLTALAIARRLQMEAGIDTKIDSVADDEMRESIRDTCVDLGIDPGDLSNVNMSGMMPFLRSLMQDSTLMDQLVKHVYDEKAQEIPRDQRGDMDSIGILTDYISRCTPEQLVSLSAHGEQWLADNATSEALQQMTQTIQHTPLYDRIVEAMDHRQNPGHPLRVQGNQEGLHEAYRLFRELEHGEVVEYHLDDVVMYDRDDVGEN